MCHYFKPLTIFLFHLFAEGGIVFLYPQKAATTVLQITKEDGACKEHP